MNVFLLVVALAAPVEVPKTVPFLPEVRISGAAVVMTDAFLPEVNAIRGVGTTPPRTDASQWGGDVPSAQIVRSAIPPQIGVWSAAVFGGPCTLVDIYAKKRMLSGPWSASRRLEAARIRGNEDEAKRMEAMLGDLVDEALEVEGAEQ